MPQHSSATAGSNNTAETVFLWGTATAALQIEGATDVDGRRESSWEVFARRAGTTYRGDTPKVACDHYHRWPEDLDLLARLGVNAYRFSVAWPRVQPRGRGPLESVGLDFYDRLVDGLLARGIRPMVTLLHSDLPAELEDAGGWTRRDTAYAFAEYSAAVYRRLSDRVGMWLTLNEPWVMAWQGYGYGQHAPGLRDPGSAICAQHHLLVGHALAAQAMRAEPGHPAIGMAVNVNPVHPATTDPRDRDAAARWDAHVHRSVLDPLFQPSSEVALERYRTYSSLTHVLSGDPELIAGTVDFLGINYYRPEYAAMETAHAGDPVTGARLVVPDGIATTSMHWPIDPEGLSETLQRLSERYPHTPLYVTENGTSCHDYVDPGGRVNDLERVDYLRQHIAAAMRARRRGVDLRGYFAWSLLDNFEWAEGYAQRFGLTFVDYPTQARVPKESFHWYRSEIERRGWGP